MGQQQIILIVLTVILVGLAITIGINFVHQKYKDSERDNIAWQLRDSANAAYHYYIKPLAHGGAGKNMKKVYKDSLNWLPELKYAQNIKLAGGEGEKSNLEIKASTMDGKKRATIILDTKGSMNLSWEDI